LWFGVLPFRSFKPASSALPVGGGVLSLSGVHGGRRLLLSDGARKEAAGVEQYVLVRGD
jgi:hypothetical protein